jgi:hypothetical protein
VTQDLLGVSENKVRIEIRGEIYRALEYLGADASLLATIGSWGDTLEDDDVLVLLKDWNDLRQTRKDSRDS